MRTQVIRTGSVRSLCCIVALGVSCTAPSSMSVGHVRETIVHLCFDYAPTRGNSLPSIPSSSIDEICYLGADIEAHGRCLLPETDGPDVDDLNAEGNERLDSSRFACVDLNVPVKSDKSVGSLLIEVYAGNVRGPMSRNILLGWGVVDISSTDNVAAGLITIDEPCDFADTWTIAITGGDDEVDYQTHMAAPFNRQR